MSKTYIEVQQKHINNGEVRTGTTCPVALALLDKFSGQRVWVDNEVIRIEGVLYHCPRSVARFVDKFDLDGKSEVKPFKFVLRKE